jgi:hypothetical protein
MDLAGKVDFAGKVHLAGKMDFAGKVLLLTLLMARHGATKTLNTVMSECIPKDQGSIL